MKKLLFPLTLFSLALLLGSCRKCEDTLIAPEFDRYFTGFKKGSYWIYQDEGSGDVDSVYVVDNNKFLRPIDRSECGREEVTIKFKGLSLLTDTITAFAMANHQDWSMGNGVFSLYGAQPLTEFSIDTTAFFNRITYSDVKRLNCNCDPNRYQNPRFIKLLYAKDVGLIYYEAVNHPVYGHIRYHLVRHKIIL